MPQNAKRMQETLTQKRGVMNAHQMHTDAMEVAGTQDAARAKKTRTSACRRHKKAIPDA